MLDLPLLHAQGVAGDVYVDVGGQHVFEVEAHKLLEYFIDITEAIHLCQIQDISSICIPLKEVHLQGHAIKPLQPCECTYDRPRTPCLDELHQQRLIGLATPPHPIEVLKEEDDLTLLQLDDGI